MCLYHTRPLKLKRGKVYERWKVLKTSAIVGEVLTGPFNGLLVKRGRWYRSPEGDGFHVFRTRRAARFYAEIIHHGWTMVEKVRVKGPCLMGLSHRHLPTSGQVMDAWAETWGEILVPRKKEEEE